MFADVIQETVHSTGLGKQNLRDVNSGDLKLIWCLDGRTVSNGILNIKFGWVLHFDAIHLK